MSDSRHRVTRRVFLSGIAGSAAAASLAACGGGTATKAAGSAAAPSGPVAGTIMFGAAVSLTGATAITHEGAAADLLASDAIRAAYLGI